MLDAVNVSVLVDVVDAGLNTGVTPAGNPLALKATLLLKPPVGVTVTVLAAVAPRVTVRLAGLADSEKLGTGGALTVRLMGTERVSPPPVPVTVTVATPSVAVLDAVNVSVLVVVVDAGLNAAITPAGKPLALKATLLAKPPVGTTVIVLVAVAP